MPNSEQNTIQNMPAILRLEPGSYLWCKCGRSAQQPFCDGTHAGSDCAPLPFTIESTRNVALCQCKQSKNPPFCDGSHIEL